MVVLARLRRLSKKWSSRVSPCQLLGQLGITQMLHVDRHRLGPTVARARLRVLIDYRAHHGSRGLLQAMDLEPETFPTERASSFVNVQPTYVAQSCGPSVSIPVVAPQTARLGRGARRGSRRSLRSRRRCRPAPMPPTDESMGDRRSSTESTWWCSGAPPRPGSLGLNGVCSGRVSETQVLAVNRHDYPTRVLPSWRQWATIVE